MRRFNGASLGLATPLDLTVRGGRLQGTLGPIFLLAPIALAAWRQRRGGRILAAGAVFAAPWLMNIGARFLIPALPFIALAIGISIARWPRTAGVIVIVNAVLCWPDVLVRYCDPYSWYLSRFPLKAALRITPEREFIDRWAPEIRYARLIQDHVPPDGVVYTAQPIMEAYTDRTILLNYASAPNARLEDTLNSVVKPELQPSIRMTFRFEPRDIRGYRLEAITPAKDWAVHEFEGPAPANVSTNLFAWDAPRAADRRLATAWRAWRPIHAGDAIECALEQPSRRDAISLRTRPDMVPELSVVLRGADGRDTTVTTSPTVQRELPSTERLRAEAITDAQKSGVTHLAIHDEEPLGRDFQGHPEDWHVRFVAAAPPLRLYELRREKSLTPTGKSETIRGESVF